MMSTSDEFRASRRDQRSANFGQQRQRIQAESEKISGSDRRQVNDGDEKEEDADESEEAGDEQRQSCSSSSVVSSLKLGFNNNSSSHKNNHNDNNLAHAVDGSGSGGELASQLKVALNNDNGAGRNKPPGQNRAAHSSEKREASLILSVGEPEQQQQRPGRQSTSSVKKQTTLSTSSHQVVVNNNELQLASVEAGGKPARRRARILDPSGSLYYHWSMVVSFAFLYNFWSLSYRFAFREIDFTTVAFWFTFDYSADLIYVLDVVINFHTGFLEDGVLEQNIDKIGQHYRECTLFYLDCFCLLPLDILYLSIGFNSILRCTRLVKIYKFWSYIDRTERHTNYPNVFRTFTLVHYILVIFHWNACLFHMISKNKIIDIENLYKINDNQCDDILCQYLHAFYWSTLALTTIGDLPKPRTKGEYLYITFELFFGLFLFASVLGHVANIVTNVSAARKEFQAKLDAVKTFMRMRRVSDDLQNKVIRWFDYLWISQKSSDEDKSVACLPDRLKAEIAIHVHLDTLKRVDIFQNTEAGFLCELVLRLKPVLFSPGDYVCRKNEVGHEMYIVSRGILEVVTDNGKTVVATLKAGSYFGEISVLNVGLAGNKRTASVRSVGYSDLFCLNKQDLWDVLKNYPNAEARIRARAEERLSKLDINQETSNKPGQLRSREFKRKANSYYRASANSLLPRQRLMMAPNCCSDLFVAECCTAVGGPKPSKSSQKSNANGCGSCQLDGAYLQKQQQQLCQRNNQYCHNPNQTDQSIGLNYSQSFDQDNRAAGMQLIAANNNSNKPIVVGRAQNYHSNLSPEQLHLPSDRGRHGRHELEPSPQQQQHHLSSCSVNSSCPSQYNCRKGSGNQLTSLDGSNLIRQHRSLKPSHSLGACESSSASGRNNRFRRSRKRRLQQQQSPLQHHHLHRQGCKTCHEQQYSYQQPQSASLMQPTASFWIPSSAGNQQQTQQDTGHGNIIQVPFLAAPTSDGRFQMLQPITLAAPSSAQFSSLSMSHLDAIPNQPATSRSNNDVIQPSQLESNPNGLLPVDDPGRLLLSRSSQSIVRTTITLPSIRSPTEAPEAEQQQTASSASSGNNADSVGST